jgi:3-hydroxybutyrate dehydrogenase
MLLLLLGLAAAVVAAILCHVLGWRKRKLPLAGKAIFITGCDSGYGFSLAIHAHERGMRVLAGCYLADGEGRHLLDNLGVRVVSLDLTKEESIRKAAMEVREYCDNTGKSYHIFF